MALEELNDSTILPRFTGSNPARWLCDLERFFSLYSIYEEDRFAYVVEYFDDEPFSWFNSWYRGHDHLTWKSFTTAMLSIFPPIPNPPQQRPHWHPETCHNTLPKTMAAMVENLSKQTPAMQNISIKTLSQNYQKLLSQLMESKYYHSHIPPQTTHVHQTPSRPPWRSVDTTPNPVVRFEWRPPWFPKTVTMPKPLPSSQPLPPTVSPLPPSSSLHQPPPSHNPYPDGSSNNFLKSGKGTHGPPLVKDTTQQNPPFYTFCSYGIIAHSINYPYPPYEIYGAHPSILELDKLLLKAPSQGVVGRHKWRPVVTEPHAIGRVEWRPPWDEYSVLVLKDVFQGGSIDTIQKPFAPNPQTQTGSEPKLPRITR